VVQAFGAAVVGRLRSLPLTNLGAYAIGIGAALATKLVAQRPALVGLPTSLPFIVLFVVLVASRKGTFAEMTGTATSTRVAGLRSRRRTFPLASVGLVGVVALGLPAVVNGSRLLTATTTIAFVLVFASLSLLVGLSRQVSLCHTVFVVFGATTLSHLLSAGVPYPLALPLAALVMVPVGALLAIPAIRLSGLFLALATFGFGVLAQSLLFVTGLAFGRDSVAFITRPSLIKGDVPFYYFVVAVVGAAVVLIELVRVTRLGRLLAGLADSPIALESLGVDPTASRVLVFCLSAFMAALAGGLLGSIVQVVNPTSFDVFQSLIWLTVLVAAGAQTFGGSVLAALLLVTVPAVFTSASVTEWQPVFFGAAAMVFAQAPNGLAGFVFRRPNFAGLAQRSAWRVGGSRGSERYVTVALSRLQRAG
jgi:ABC-type branched-subunit amino acid transport system permease subunit